MTTNAERTDEYKTSFGDQQQRRTGRGRRRPSPFTGRLSEAPRRGAKRTLMETIQQLPNYVRLLFGLLRDRRVSNVDKLLVAGAVAYIALPFDFIPDFIPFLGEVDDIFLLVTALQRLISNAGRQVVLDHWAGDVAELSDLNLKRVLSAATFFLPLTMRRRLKGILRG